MNPNQTYTRYIVGILLVIIIGVIGYFVITKYQARENTVTFMCKSDKSIVATFYPKNDTHVDLKLSDGRAISLPHVMSGSGARYANADETVVFWNKGTTAMVIETGTTTYEGCDTQPLSAASTTPATGGTGQPTGTVKPDGLSGYTNGEYNFSLRFSPSIQPTNFFSTFHILASNWRINAAQANQGKAIVSFPIFRIDQGDVATGKSYPLFYDTEVRVGVSPNVAKCYEADAGYANQKVTNVVINGVTFKKFSSSDAAMMKYIQAESYRTIHNNNCYVLEQVRTGSSYKDDTMKPGLSQATLDSYYNMGETIIKTFKFTK